jgi:8-oxo-dGTP pyrophosphatase MutT (NUDIX family)
LLDLKIDRDGVTPKDAATIILVRNADPSSDRDAGDAGVEVFCVERSKQSRFLGGAIVFPGGKVDPSDASEDWIALCTRLRALRKDPQKQKLDAFTTSDAHLRTLTIAACRETLEEAAMLHVTGARASEVNDAELLALRARLTTDPAALRTFLGERGLLLDLGALHPLARWVTPETEARRYDARFFVAVAPPGQAGAHDEHETMASFWATPKEVIRRWQAGEVQVAPPTHCTLALLSSCATTDDVLALANESCLDSICPRLVRQIEAIDEAETLALALPGDPEHEIKERRVPGPSRYVLRGDRWQAEDAPR